MTVPWYVSTLESFAVTHVRPAPPERVEARRRAKVDREKIAHAEALAAQAARRTA